MKKFVICLFAVTAAFALAIGATAMAENIHGDKDGVHDIAPGGTHGGTHGTHGGTHGEGGSHHFVQPQGTYEPGTTHQGTAGSHGTTGNNAGGLMHGAENIVGGVVQGAENIVGGVVQGAENIVGGATHGAGNITGGTAHGTHSNVHPQGNTSLTATERANDRNPSTGVGFGLLEFAAIGTTMLGTAALATRRKR